MTRATLCLPSPRRLLALLAGIVFLLACAASPGICQPSASPLERGMVSLTFDDGLAGVYKHALPILRSRNQTGVTGIIPTKLCKANNDYMTLEQIKALQDHGWEIASHGYTHKRPTDIPRTYADEKLNGWRLDDRKGHVFQTAYEYAQIACMTEKGERLQQADTVEEMMETPGSYFFDREIEELHVKPRDPSATAATLDVRACSYERELDASRKALEKMGLRVTSYITPYNFWNNDLKELSRKYYDQVATGWGAANDLNSFDPRYISRNVIHEHDTVASVTRLLKEKAVTNREWVVLCFHDIGEMIGWEPWTAEKMNKLSEWIAEQGLVTVTLSQGARIFKTAMGDNWRDSPPCPAR